MRQNRDILAEYPMRSELSSSPICSVYRSLAPDDGAEAVVKIIAAQAGADDAANRERFLRSIETARSLELPCFPRLLDFGFTEGDGAFMVMEWVAGIGIGGLTGCSPTRTIPLLIQVIEALEAMARQHVFHHNLSPSDILVVESDAIESARIVGFGTAAYHPKIKRSAIHGRTPMGAGFLPPELRELIDTPDRGAATDIFSIALIATELFGCEVYGAGVQKPVVLLPEPFRGSLEAPKHIEEVLARALRMDASERPSYDQLETALREFLAGTDDAAESADTPHQAAADENAQLGETMILELPGDASPTEVGAMDPVTDGGAPQTEVTPPPIPVPPPLELHGDAPEHPVPPPLPPPPQPITGSSAGPASDATHDPHKTNPALRLDELGIPPPTPVPVAAPSRNPLATILGNRRVLLGVVAAAAALAVISLLLVTVNTVRGRTESPSPTPVEVVRATPRPTPAAEPEEAQLHPLLEQADQLLMDGELDAAKELVASISPADVAAFSAIEESIYNEIVNAAASSRVESAIADLEGGLDLGSIRMIKRGVAGLERADEADWADRPGLRATLEDARHIIRLHGELWDAHNAGDHEQVLQSARAIIAALPKYSTPYDFRNQAAAALESRAEQLAERGEYAEALSTLAVIQQHWPERDGLEERAGRIESARSSFATQEAAIAAAVARGEDGEPERGLADLASLTPIAVLRNRYDTAKQQLHSELAAIDAAAPVVALAPECELSFKKKEPAQLVFVVTDDHRVAAVRAHIKTVAAAAFTELDAQPTGDGTHYQLLVPPETHGGDDFLLYVEATDVSDHTGHLGSAEQPLEVSKKGFLKSIFKK